MIIVGRVLLCLCAVALLALVHFIALWFATSFAVHYGGSDWEWPLAGLLLLSFIGTATVAVAFFTRKAR